MAEGSRKDQKKTGSVNRSQEKQEGQKKHLTFSDEPFYVMLRTVARTRRSNSGLHEETSIS